MFIVFTPQKLDFNLTFGVLFINEHYKFDIKRWLKLKLKNSTYKSKLDGKGSNNPYQFASSHFSIRGKVLLKRLKSTILNIVRFKSS